MSQGLNFSKFHFDGKYYGTNPHSLDATTTCAIRGPKYKTNVCNPVPRPIEKAIPSPIHQIANFEISIT